MRNTIFGKYKRIVGWIISRHWLFGKQSPPARDQDTSTWWRHMKKGSWDFKIPLLKHGRPIKHGAWAAMRRWYIYGRKAEINIKAPQYGSITVNPLSVTPERDDLLSAKLKFNLFKASSSPFLHAPLATNNVAALPIDERSHWSPFLSTDLYRIDVWGASYFSVNTSDNISVSPYTFSHRSVAWCTLESSKVSAVGVWLHNPILWLWISLPRCFPCEIQSG